jgi:hypothetical protein
MAELGHGVPIQHAHTIRLMPKNRPAAEFWDRVMSGPMRSPSILALVAALPLVACSSGSSSGPAGSAVATSDTQELDIDEGTFTVPAGGEIVICERVPMPAAFKGRDLAVSNWESDIPAPAHHYFMFYDTTPTSGTEPVPCEGDSPIVQASGAGLNLFSMGALLLVAGTGHDTFAGNPDYGMVLQANGTFVTNHHVINAGAAPVTVSAHFKLSVRNATEVAHPTRALSCQTTDISLPPDGTTDVTATCLAPFDLDVVTMSSHAHQDLMTFEQRFFDGTTTQPAVLYTSSVWDTPRVQQLDTPLHLKAGQGITFTCHYRNQTSASIGFGLTADSEMCAAMNDYAYPVDRMHEVPPMLGATIFTNATPATVSNTSGSAIPLF